MKKNYSFPPVLLALLLVALAACAPPLRQRPQATATLPPPFISTFPADTLAPTAVPPSATATTAPNPPGSTQTPGAVPQAGSYSDPFAYCAAVGTADTPDVRYTGSRMPDVLAQGLKKASGASADAPMEMFTTGAYWRCMDGKVYACTVGANLPCDSKANTDKTPTQPELDFCAANPTADVIPAAVTGHDTIYDWSCKSGKPEAGKQVFQVDKQGFIAEIWYEIPGK
jgi:hypothetical protein